MRTPLLFLAAVTIVAACTSHPESGDIEIILPGEDRNDTDFYDAVKSVEVIDLEVDSNYFYIEDADLQVSDNYYYFVPKYMSFRNNTAHLVCYDKATGKIQFSRKIAGRSRAEVTEICGSFAMDDKIVLNDCGILKMYDNTGKFCGTLCDTSLHSNCLLPFGDGYISCDFFGSYYDRSKCLTLMDKDFNIGESYFELPDDFELFANILTNTPNIYVINNSLHFWVQNTFRLNTFPDGKTYRFIPSNPMPESVKAQAQDMFFTLTCIDGGYATAISGWVENQGFIMFDYLEDRYIHHVLLSKSDNKVYGWNRYASAISTTFDVWQIIIGQSDIIYSDGKYFYAKLLKKEISELKNCGDIFNDMQRAVYDTMQARLARNADNEFEYFYLKILMEKD